MKGKLKVTVVWEDGKGNRGNSIDANVLHGVIGMLERRFSQVRVKVGGPVISIEAWGEK